MIKKTSETRALAGNIVNAYNDSQTSAYSTEYINDMMDYSTSEVNTGKKWIDGKPIYRKVITGTTPTTTNNLLYSDSNIDVLVNSYGIVKTQATSTERWVSVNSYSNNGEYNSIVFIPNTGLYFNGAYVLGTPYKITIEYTKTTD